MSDEPMSRAAAEHTTKNLALAGRFLREALDDPAILDAILAGSTLVLMPPDDPELAAANLHLAERLSAESDVHVYPVGQPRPECEQAANGPSEKRPTHSLTNSAS